VARGWTAYRRGGSLDPPFGFTRKSWTWRAHLKERPYEVDLIILSLSKNRGELFPCHCEESFPNDKDDVAISA
jgi:hypothetical protein